MSDRSKIEWTDASWNPLVVYGERLTVDATGYAQHRGWHCEHVSEGCRNCYAETINRRLGTGRLYKPGHRGDLTFSLEDKTLLQPLHWKKPRKIFVGSMTDLFGDWVTDEQLDRIFAVMALCSQHTFQVLTKRPERMRSYVSAFDLAAVARYHAPSITQKLKAIWPLRNVWLGVSCEDQATADERIPLLLDTPAAVRFVSAEPLLGPIDFEAMPFADGDRRHKWSALTGQALMYGEGVNGHPDITVRMEKPIKQKLDLIIVGGESGPNARPMHQDWARSPRDQCKAAGVAYFFKQWGEHLPWSQFNEANIIDDPEQTRFLTHEWENGVWRDVGRPMCCDSTDGNIDADHCFGRVGKKRAGRLLDGVEHNEFPRVQQ